MKRSLYIFPLMAFTALSLTLAGCDDTTEGTAEQSATTAPVETTAPVAPVTIYASNATAFATAEGAKTGAVFVTLQSPQTAIDKLIGASTEKAATAEVHEGFVDEADGTMQMRKVESVEILPSQIVELKPGGYHIMLMDLTAPLVEGDTFNVTLKFQNAGDIIVPVTVTAPGGTADTTAAPAADEHSHDHGTAAEPAATTDVPVTEEEVPSAPTTIEGAAPAPVTVDESVPADQPVTDEQPAQ